MTKQINVFSNREDDFTDVTVTFIDDLIESWISKKMFEVLDLDATLGSPGDPEWGFLGKKSVPLGGTTKLQWVPKGSKKTQETTCRIVDSKKFEIFLQAHLLPSNPVPTAKRSGFEPSPSQEPVPDVPPVPNPRMPATVDKPSVQMESLYNDTSFPKENTGSVPGIKPVGSFDGLPETISDTSEE